MHYACHININTKIKLNKHKYKHPWTIINTNKQHSPADFIFCGLLQHSPVVFINILLRSSLKFSCGLLPHSPAVFISCGLLHHSPAAFIPCGLLQHFLRSSSTFSCGFLWMRRTYGRPTSRTARTRTSRNTTADYPDKLWAKTYTTGVWLVRFRQDLTVP